MMPRLSLALCGLLLLSGCDMLGIESASALAARKAAEGKAVGAACRHAGRALEDCYALNKRVDKAGIFAGWREMNDYMRENDIAVVPSRLQADMAASPDEAAAEPAAAPAKGRSRVVARAKGTTLDKASSSKRALISMPRCPADGCPVCRNKRQGREPGGARGCGRTGLRCLLPLRGKGRRSVVWRLASRTCSQRGMAQGRAWMGIAMIARQITRMPFQQRSSRATAPEARSARTSDAKRVRSRVWWRWSGFPAG